MQDPRPMVFRMRPFERVLERPDGGPAVRCRGEIRNGSFQFSVHDTCFSLPTVNLGSDEWGEYAEVEGCELSVREDLILAVRPEYPLPSDPPEQVGCEISLFKPGPVDTYRAQVRAQGWDPDKRNLLVPPDSSISIYFNWAGSVDGHGGPIGIVSNDRREESH